MNRIIVLQEKKLPSSSLFWRREGTESLVNTWRILRLQLQADSLLSDTNCHGNMYHRDRLVVKTDKEEHSRIGQAIVGLQAITAIDRRALHASDKSFSSLGLHSLAQTIASWTWIWEVLCAGWWYSQEIASTHLFTSVFILVNHKEEWNYVIFEKWMKLENIMLSELRQNQRQKSSVFSHIWKTEWKLKLKNNI